jgi:glycosyltransferase involved in cell wall biosynthesis
MIGQPQSAKVLRVIARLNTGGPAVHTILLTRWLNSGRFNSRLVTGMVAPDEGDMEYYAKSQGVVPIVLPELGRDFALRNDLVALWKLLRLFHQEKPDIIHTHTTKAGGLGRVAGIFYNIGRIVSRKRRAKFVHSFHGHIFRGYFPSSTSRLFVFIERALAKMTHRIVTVSESIKRDLVDVYRICSAEKVTVIPLGLDLSWVNEIKSRRGELLRKFRVPPDRVTIGIVGRLTEIKNHRLFLSAARNLAGKVDAHFFVIGDGALTESMVQVAREFGVGEQVTFTGWLQKPAQIYGDLDVVCLTSLNEGTPVVLVEAMAAGRSFVATDVGGIRDMVVGPGVVHPDGFEIFANGILTRPNDVETLTAALSFLAQHLDVRRHMGAVGQQIVREKYSYTRLLADIDSLYMELLGFGSERGSFAGRER